MRNKLFIILPCFLIAERLTAQTITTNIYTRLDTLVINYVKPTFDTLNDGLNRYFSGKLAMVGVQSDDGRTGFWKEYYPQSGILKVTGYYKKTPTGNCTAEICSLMEGNWKYYNSTGKLKRIDVYKNGNLISSKHY